MQHVPELGNVRLLRRHGERNYPRRRGRTLAKPFRQRSGKGDRWRQGRATVLGEARVSGEGGER